MMTMVLSDLAWTSFGIFAGTAAAPERLHVPNRMDIPLDEGQLR
jgi:hypothetical protein